MNKPARTALSVGAALLLWVYFLCLLVSCIMIAAWSGQESYGGLTFVLGLVPMLAIVLALSKNSGHMPAPKLIQNNQGKTMLILIAIYGVMLLIVWLSGGLK